MFPPVYIINLDKDVERMEKIHKECLKQNIEYKKISAIYGKYLTEQEIKQNTSMICNNICTLPSIGCGLSHIKTWNQIYEDGHEMAIILEDDSIFLKDIKQKFEKYRKQFPIDWELIYLGCNGACTKESYTTLEWLNLIAGTLIGSSIFHKTISENIFIPEFPIGAHAYLVNRKFCEKMKDIKLKTHIDLQLAQDNNIKKYAVSPKIFCSTSENSNIASKNYPHLTLNALSKIKQRGIDYAWVLSEPQMQIRGIECKPLSYLCFLISLILQIFLPKHAWKIILAIHTPEILYSFLKKQSFTGFFNCILFHLLGFGFGFLLKQK